MSYKRFDEMGPGTWFVGPGRGDEVLVKLAAPVGKAGFQAVSVITGLFHCPQSSTAADVVYDVVEGLKPLRGELRYDSAEKRNVAEATFHQLFPGIETSWNDSPGAFFLLYLTTPSEKARIKAAMGGC